MFKYENAKSNWNKRYPYLAAVYRKYNVASSVEIGVARGGLSRYLLSHVPSIVVHYGVDPFLGGYDDENDAMSKILTQANSSTIWSSAILFSLKSFQCKFKLFHGYSHDGAALIESFLFIYLFIYFFVNIQ
jgi:hypothetical protein